MVFGSRFSVLGFEEAPGSSPQNRKPKTENRQPPKHSVLAAVVLLLVGCTDAGPADDVVTPVSETRKQLPVGQHDHVRLESGMFGNGAGQLDLEAGRLSIVVEHVERRERGVRGDAQHRSRRFLREDRQAADRQCREQGPHSR